jgi:hypothetical protein
MIFVISRQVLKFVFCLVSKQPSDTRNIRYGTAKFFTNELNKALV